MNIYTLPSPFLLTPIFLCPDLFLVLQHLISIKLFFRVRERKRKQGKNNERRNSRKKKESGTRKRGEWKAGDTGERKYEGVVWSVECGCWCWAVAKTDADMFRKTSKRQATFFSPGKNSLKRKEL